MMDWVLVVFPIKELELRQFLLEVVPGSTLEEVGKVKQSRVL